MLKSKPVIMSLSFLTAASLLLAACAAPTQTQEVPVTTVVTQVVTVTETPQPGVIPASGLIACKETPAASAGGKGPGLAAANVAQPSSPSVKTQVGSPAAAETVYRVGIFEDLTSTNFFQANGPDNSVWNAYFLLPQRLALFGTSDQRFQLIPQAAADWASPLTQEGDNWISTVPLKKGITWSDGEPFTAKDMAFTANTSLRFGLVGGNWQSWFDPNYLDHVEAVDDTTVKFVYHTKPGIARHDWGDLQAPILSEHFWKPLVDEAAKPLEGLTKPDKDATEEDKTKYAEAETQAQENLYAIDPNGEPMAGAFTFSKWEKSAFAENATNPDYFFNGANIVEYANGAYHESKANVYDFTAYGEATGDPTLEYTNGPHVNAAVYSIYSSQDAAVLALKNGEIDFILNPLGLQRGLLSQVQDDPNLTVIKNKVNGFRYLSFNTRRKPMDDCSFRQAVATLIDKDFVTKTILQNVAFPLYTFVPEANAAWYFDGVPKFGLKADGTPMTREERVNQAVAILEGAGYSWEGGAKPAWDADNRQVTPSGALLLPDGTPVPQLEILAPSPGYDPLRSTFAIWIESWLNEVGIPAKANLAGFNVILQRVFSDQDFDMYILGYSLSIFPSYMRDFWHSDQAVKDGNNAGGYSNPKFDELSEALLTCDSAESCKKASDQLQILVSTELPMVVLFDTGIIETYRSAALEYPYTDTLSGLQYINGLPAAVAVK